MVPKDLPYCREGGSCGIPSVEAFWASSNAITKLSCALVELGCMYSHEYATAQLSQRTIGVPLVAIRNRRVCGNVIHTQSALGGRCNPINTVA